jgi:putative tricarboxylic transport membrane protein
VLPGIGPVATISLLLPITFGQPATTAIIMLAGIYYGAQYGGSTTAILLNLPGEVSSVVTTLEGYKMARKGAPARRSPPRPSGFFAGTVATVLVAASGPLLTQVALSFGPADYFSLMLLGLIISAVLAQGSVVKAIGMVVLGVGSAWSARTCRPASSASPSASRNCRTASASSRSPWACSASPRSS